jgi:predicted GNAT family acetyltransferase
VRDAERMREHTGESRTASTEDDTDHFEVVDNPERGRFELRDGERVIGVASYALVTEDRAEDASEQAPDRVVLFHTEVIPEYEGQGLAGRLASQSLDATIASGRSVVALCPYIKAYVQRHPEPYAAHLVAPTQPDVDAAQRAASAAR